MAVVVQWTGLEAALLGEAMRLPIRAYAGQLGVNPRTVTKWRKRGRDLVLMPETQDMLDAMLRRCPPDVMATFHASLGEASDGGLADGASPASHEAAGLPLGPAVVISHKFVPVYLGKDVHSLFSTAAPCELGPGSLEHRALPAEHPDAEAESRLHLYACGVAIYHLVQRRRVDRLGDLAEWRYRSYESDLVWAREQLRELFPGSAQAAAGPGYVLSAYLLEESPWRDAALEAALQMLATPSVVVDRQHPDGPTRLGDDVERMLLSEGVEHADVVDFGSRAVAMGRVGWSGVAYHPLSADRALPMGAIVALELDVQTLWALSTYVLDEIEAGRDPVMPDEYGWRFLRGAYSRLTAARPQETAQHQLMREAILATSQLPDRLRAAQDALRESA
ncbi:XRE family transcriptional regulator [Streptomyces ipomoeae]|uniref:XRE family transcriptional regulator n=1 Tax=Streptomyces ipomoeae TaxID=103232 RepID=UPI00114674BB|nr:XRE family transcriptional regulator [Streptomyces ipomoeae]TQE33187.1 XRE family transcriptional regulator [Streptomyces ipomoeae]